MTTRCRQGVPQPHRPPMNKPVGPADVIDFGGLHLVADHEAYS